MKVRIAALVAASMLFGTHAFASDVVGIITKTNTNPGFVKMREGAEEKAKELGLELRSFAGKFDGDNDGQVEAIENLVAAGAKGILITPSDTKAIVPAVQAARDAGVLVIALDTPLEPIDAADATFGTDNFKAGQLIGQWASKTLGDKIAKAKIAFLDLAVSQPSVDFLRDQGFMKGFGIDIKDPNHYGDETDARICGHEMTGGAEDGGRTAMEKLLQKCSDINVVYTINEPSAAGAWEALKAVGKDDGSVLVVSIDGGCPGVKNVEAGVIGATSMQFLKNMGSIGVDALNKYLKTGEKPQPTPGLKFFDTGVKLITDKPVDGVESIDTKKGLQLCWG
ncbi:sugar ABC transporter substrate-binding protein [Rhizobium leguminosarum]|uniref:sugar ABC transporter substrate-binding protein n=1 Tax=Rhizobium leguminosarum TaxID=384 RepID=UPI001441C567|nr:sugar ABC transporter substrate-binding protein [Rhizobium leguminosarum]MBY5904208.1 sugar ABC transporter substrate-binding protein [Rhizobium leguminosarum]MBY5911577.1 sugar ABC transporter substrate-binding protein [Rhizobium leguminosarum]NKK89197.1 substrate-binding domain-containing protein [Rhizobium leguminosarum bv. viciae]